MRAALVVAAPHIVHSPGEIVFDARGVVLDVRACRTRGTPARAIVPGLVDAHVHLQIPALRRPERDFMAWIRAVMAMLRALDPQDLQQHADRALDELLQAGCTAVGEIDSTGLSPAVLRERGIEGRCYQELVGFDLDRDGARAAVRRRALPGTRRCPRGLAPHAPYSVSAALFRAARERGTALMVHVAEVEGELELLQHGRGGLRDLLVELGKWPVAFRAPRLSPVRWLARLGVLGPRCALVHAQHLEEGDVELIRERRSPLVVCPGTIEYFGRSVPRVEQWLARGIPVALGTDSRASNTELSMRTEMRRARLLWPSLPPAEVLAMATVHGGRALGRRVGRLRQGLAASFAVVDLPRVLSVAQFMDSFTGGELPIAATWVRGECMVRSR